MLSSRAIAPKLSRKAGKPDRRRRLQCSAHYLFETLFDHQHHFRYVIECSAVGVAFEFRQIKNNDLLLLECAAIWLCFRIDIAETLLPTPYYLRQVQGVVVLRREQQEAWPRKAHS